MFNNNAVGRISIDGNEAKAISALFPEYAKVDLAKTYTNEFVTGVLEK